MGKRLQSWKKYGIGAAAMFVLVSVIPRASGWAEAAVSTVQSVLVTNTATQALEPSTGASPLPWIALHVNPVSSGAGRAAG
jgi:hypothetical protein